MKSLNEQVLLSILKELDYAKTKRKINHEAGLPHDLLDARIVDLETAKRIHEEAMIEEAIKEQK